MEQAKAGRLHILDCMEKETASEFEGFQPRTELSRYAPRVLTLRIKPDRIRDVIGPGGKVIRAIQETTGTKIDIEDTGEVTMFSPDGVLVSQAESRRIYGDTPGSHLRAEVQDALGAGHSDEAAS